MSALLVATDHPDAGDRHRAGRQGARRHERDQRGGAPARGRAGEGGGWCGHLRSLPMNEHVVKGNMPLSRSTQSLQNDLLRV